MPREKHKHGVGEILVWDNVFQSEFIFTFPLPQG